MKKFLIILLLILLILPASLSLFRPGFFPSDDGEWMVIRLTDFHRSFVSGQIPVRWAERLNHGYGYPVFNFLYPLSLYWGEFFHLIGFSFVWSIKLVFIFSFFLSGIFMYLFAKELWGRDGGLLAAVAYTYAPYRFVDVYVRGSIGEAVSFVFIPLIFWSLFRLSEKISNRWLAIGVFSLAALIMSHNIIVMLLGPVILIYAGWLIWEAKNKKQLLIFYSLFLFLGLFLSCFFWLPALFDKQFTILDQMTVTNYWEHFPSLKQLIIPSWGYGPSLTSGQDQTSYQIGFIHLLAVVFSFGFLFKFQSKEKKHQVLFFLLAFFVAFFLMLPASWGFWRIAPLLWRTQFPWRLLALTAFFSSILTGGLVFVGGMLYLVKPNLKNWLVAFLLVLIIAVNFNYARPEFFIIRPEGFYSTNEATTTVKDEYMPIWVKEKPTQRASQRVEIISGEAQIQNLFFNSKKTSFILKAVRESEVQFNTVYFPGWQAKINDQPTQIDYNNSQGVIRFKVPVGEHQILIEFKETPVRQAANLISLLALAITGGLLVERRRHDKKD